MFMNSSTLLPSQSKTTTTMQSLNTPEKKKKKNNHQKNTTSQIYSREFQAMIDSLEEEDYREEASQACIEKKRRLTFEQVKALEKNFEVENKLEPDRKTKLAEELGLQPRQIAVWFQNRRARLKTKELERDYGVLKANYDALKQDYTNIEQEHQALRLQLKELKSKMISRESEESSQGAEEAETPVSEQSKNRDFYDNVLHVSPASSSSMNWIVPGTELSDNVYQQQPHFVKLEESLFGSDVNIFSVDQAPSLQWYFTGQ